MNERNGGRTKSSSIQAVFIVSALAFFSSCAVATVEPTRIEIPVASAKAAAGNPSCEKASMLLQEAERFMQTKDKDRLKRLRVQRCAAKMAQSSVQLCATLRDNVQLLLDEYNNEFLHSDFYDFSSSADGRWVLANAGGRAFVWERRGAELILVWQLDINGNWEMTSDARVMGGISGGNGEADSLVVIDLETARVASFQDATLYGVEGKNLILSSSRRLQRVDWTSLQLRDDVRLGRELTLDSSQHLRVFEQSRAAVSGNGLVSLSTGAVLATADLFLGASEDQSRILACNEKLASVFDTRTGKTISQYDISGTVQCSFTKPALSPDGRYWVGLERGEGAHGENYMIVVVLDTKTNKVRKTPFPKAGYGTALGASLEVTGNYPATICVSLGNMHWRQDICPWSLNDQGLIGVSTKVTAKKKVPIRPNVIEIDRISSRDGQTNIIATYQDQTKVEQNPEFRHLHLWIADQQNRILRDYELADSRFSFSLSSDEGNSPPKLRILDSEHVLFDAGSGYVQSYVVELAHGSVIELDRDMSFVGDKYGRIGDKLVDLTTQRAFTLVPDSKALAGIHRYISCEQSPIP